MIEGDTWKETEKLWVDTRTPTTIIVPQSHGFEIPWLLGILYKYDYKDVEVKEILRESSAL